MKTIIVPVDGASNIKLEVLDFETLAPLESVSTETPVTNESGLDYNDTGEEFAWFDNAIRKLAPYLRHAAVIAPVARGASGGLVGDNNELIEVPGRELTLAYTQDYPAEVHERFAEIAGPEDVFFSETGSIRDFPGSLTLLKRLIFEEMERPSLLEKSAHFANYGTLMSGHFLGDYANAASVAGNEQSYWMCHSGARNIKESPGTISSAASAIESFRRLVPEKAALCYKAIGSVPAEKVKELELDCNPLVVPGGHDTCLSHIPIMSTWYQAFPENAGKPVIQVEGGSWTLVALIGGKAAFTPDAYTRDVVVQGTVDGQPVVTARYGGGNDFREIKRQFKEQGADFFCDYDATMLETVISDLSYLVLPNIAPVNRKSGPFPALTGAIPNPGTFFSNPAKAFVASNLMTSLVTALQVEALNVDPSVPIALTAGASRDPWFGRLLASFSGREVYGMYDCDGYAISETTTLGAAIAGKAAVLGIHPYLVDVAPLCVSYRRLDPITGCDADFQRYRAAFLAAVEQELKKSVG